MTRWEARTTLTAALVMVVAGLVWLLGPWGLLVPGVLLLVAVLFLIDVRETAGAEVVADLGRAGHRHPVLDRRLRR